MASIQNSRDLITATEYASILGYAHMNAPVICSISIQLHQRPTAWPAESDVGLGCADC